MEWRVGTRVGRYEIVGEVGRGAMGVVYQARDPKIDRLVAIKTICLIGQEAQDETEYRERFFMEAKTAGRLSHPGIVTIFDVGEEPETREPYIVMEYVAGQSLSKLLSAQNKKLPVGVALRLAQELAEALDYAHTQGVVHRDIKPANILVTRDGHAKVADFGIARLNMAHMTLPGEVLGSPAYMAPEQLSGEGVDARSDLFSVGVILYTMLTGFRPFQGNSATTVCFKVVNRDPIPVSAFDSELPPELDRIVNRAMAKEPEERYQSGGEMARDIEALRSCEKPTQSEEDLLPGLVAAMEIPVSTAITPALPPEQNAENQTQPSFVAAHISFVHEGKSSANILGEPNPSRSGTSSTRRQAIHRRKQTLATVAAAAALGIGILYLGWLGLPDRWKVSDAVVKIPNQVVSAEWAERIQSTTPAPVAVIARADRGKSQNLKVPLTKEHKARLVSVSATKALEKDRSSSVARPAELQIDIQHPFTKGNASIWLDRKLVFTSPVHGQSKPYALLFRTTEGTQRSSLQVLSGEHQIHVRVQAASDQYDQSKTIDAKLLPGDGNILHVVCDKHHNVLQLTVQQQLASATPASTVQ
jgi:serine/threonine protein kinase